MIPSIMYYVPPSVKLLGPTTHPISNPDPRPPDFKPDWRRCDMAYNDKIYSNRC